MLDIPSALLVSDADVLSLAAREAEEVVRIDGSTARDSYLDPVKVIDAAKRAGCDAIHPGYGFLSENAEFADAVTAAGLLFVGPSGASIRALGNKPNARRTVQAVGVPTTPGSGEARTDKELQIAAERIGYPLIIKAAAGGGGRGMRIIRESGSLLEGLERARAEALKNFGSAEVYFEKFIEEPRHVEVQLFGDRSGNVLHFGTRDCSAQRRHQKLVEEAPAPFLTARMREAIHKAAVDAARSVGYYNAGTAEFLVKDDEFYFLEINTRIQVEHPVTEMITGLDLVALQLRIAMGEPLPMTQEEVTFSGHAIEFRINAEDPLDGFRPATGTITGWERPRGFDYREEAGYAVGDAIPPYYDSLMSKVIVHEQTRGAALTKSYEIFRTYELGGVPSSVAFHRWILSTPEFQTDGIDIGFVERCFDTDGAATAQRLMAPHDDHVPPLAEAMYVERREVSLGHGRRVELEVVHEPGGTFLARPLDSSRQPQPQRTWRRSNDRLTAVRAVTELLEGQR